MRENLMSKLRLLLCFGMMVFLSLAAPKDVEAHIEAVGQAPPGYVYDLYNPWDATNVGWFTHDKKVSGSVKWYTKGYYVTTYPLLDYTIPAGALQVSDYGTKGLPSPDCTESGYVDTLHLFDRWLLYGQSLFVVLVEINESEEHSINTKVFTAEFCENYR